MKYVKPIGLAALAAMALTAFFGAGTASATQLYKYTTPSANDALGVGATIKASVEGSTTFEDTEEDLLIDTCTFSEIHGEIDDVVGGHPTGAIDTLIFGGCSHTTHVLTRGAQELRHIAGTTNGTVFLKDVQITIASTVFGISCTVNTEWGTPIGTLTGAKSPTGHARLDVNAVVPVNFWCGGDARWTGSYVVTTPTGLTAEP